MDKAPPILAQLSSTRCLRHGSILPWGTMATCMLVFPTPGPVHLLLPLLTVTFSQACHDGLFIIGSEPKSSSSGRPCLPAHPPQPQPHFLLITTSGSSQHLLAFESLHDLLIGRAALPSARLSGLSLRFSSAFPGLETLWAGNKGLWKKGKKGQREKGGLGKTKGEFKQCP